MTRSRVFRAGSDSVYDADDRTIAWGTSRGRGPLGGSVIMAHLSVTLQAVVVVTEATVGSTVV